MLVSRAAKTKENAMRLQVALLLATFTPALAASSISMDQKMFAPVDAIRHEATMVQIDVRYRMEPADCAGKYTLRLDYSATPHRPQLFDSDLSAMRLYAEAPSLRPYFQKAGLPDGVINLGTSGVVILNLDAPKDAIIGNERLLVSNESRVEGSFWIPICKARE